MSSETEHRVRSAYERAVEAHLQKSLQSGQDWDRYNAILAQTKARLAEEDQAFARDFDARMAEARQIVLREEHGIALDQPQPPGVDPKSPQAMEAKAEARVYRDHERRQAAIRHDATEQYVDLTAEIRARDAPTSSQSLTQTWNQSRSGPTRT
ncbi:hypothetical protein [Thalassovita sp.]|uniref:hypothetical protein n=1 Tax=Thalassovita sp. TaxID=1979401 RepID=UPI002881A838|nr:hypothetical protein [Thalassovita sp.]MDF1804369.1 hypothetical protein [Thalassovita sp.]